MKLKATLAVGLGGLVALIACSDPPPPSLAGVGIDQVYDNTGKTQITYIYSDIANCRGLEGSVAAGLTMGDGLTIGVALRRSIRDLPDEDAQADALLKKPFTFAVTGDAFKIDKAKEADRVIISALKIGEGTLVISVDGASGSFAMPVRIVDQSTTTFSNIYRDKDCVAVVPDSGASTSDAGTSSDASGE